MPESSFPKSENLFRGDRDDHGFQIIYLKLFVAIRGNYIAEVVVPVDRNLYDRMSTDDLTHYLKHLAMKNLYQDMSLTVVTPNGCLH